MVRKEWPIDERWSPDWSSPGPGSAGSLKLRFMATTDLRRCCSFLPTCGDARLRFELVDDRRESCCWCWMPALIVAAAARETDEDRGDGVGAVSAPRTRDWSGELFGERDRGREFRSGAIFAACTIKNTTGQKRLRRLVVVDRQVPRLLQL